MSKKSFVFVATFLSVIAFMPMMVNASIYNAAITGDYPVSSDSKDVVLKEISETISPDKVNVNYKIHNSSDKKTAATMGYRMPVLRSDYMHAKLYKDFTVKIGEEQLKINESRRASIDGKDITSTLAKYNLQVPIDSCLRGDDKKFAVTAQGLDAKQKRELAAIGVDIDNILKGDCWLPWDLEISYNWNISLEGKQDKEISVNYTPNLTSFAIPVLSEKIKQDYCIDEATYAALSKKIGFGKTYPYFFEELMTPARNWKAAIEKIQVNIESKKVGSYVFSCYDNLERKSEFELSSEQFNIEPNEDLKVLFLLKN